MGIWDSSPRTEYAAQVYPTELLVGEPVRWQRPNPSAAGVELEEAEGGSTRCLRQAPGGPERRRRAGTVRTGRSQAGNVQKYGGRGDLNSGHASCSEDRPGTPSRKGRPSMTSHGELGP